MDVSELGGSDGQGSVALWILVIDAEGDKTRRINIEEPVLVGSRKRKRKLNPKPPGGRLRHPPTTLQRCLPPGRHAISNEGSMDSTPGTRPIQTCWTWWPHHPSRLNIVVLVQKHNPEETNPSKAFELPYNLREPTEKEDRAEYSGAIFHAGEVNEWCIYKPVDYLINHKVINRDGKRIAVADLRNFAIQVRTVVKSTVEGSTTEMIDRAEATAVDMAAVFGLAAVKIYACLSQPEKILSCSGVAVKASSGGVYILTSIHGFYDASLGNTAQPKIVIEALKDTGRIMISWDQNLLEPGPPRNKMDRQARIVTVDTDDDLAIFKLEQNQDLSEDQHTINLSDICTLQPRDPTTATNTSFVKGETQDPVTLQHVWANEGRDKKAKLNLLAHWSDAQILERPTLFDYFCWRYFNKCLSGGDTLEHMKEKQQWFGYVYRPYRSRAVGSFHFTENSLQALH
ncbi:MAG: hypothetical protein Q9226_008640 [Calogaya cf. arnoldii]